MGKYCVRFGSHVRQFCSNVCLEDHKKGLKACFFCLCDIGGGEGFLAPVSTDRRGQLFKDFCSENCLKRYQVMNGLARKEDKVVKACAVCNQLKAMEIELLRSQDNEVKLCSQPCLFAFCFSNNVRAFRCDMCEKYANSKALKLNTIYYEKKSKTFCGAACRNIFIHRSRKIVHCTWCKVKKYNFDMIEKWSTEDTW